VKAPPLAGHTLTSKEGSIALAEWTDEGESSAERPIAGLHVHHADDEAWYVLAGVLRVRIGDDVVEVPAGGAAIVPGGTAHTYWNPGPEPARYLLVMGVRTYELIQAIHAPNRGDLRELFVQYGAELLE